MRTEEEFRAALAAEALSWIGTPWRGCGSVKGAGVNCAMFLYCVAREAGALAPDAPEPKWFTPQMALHSREERLIEYLVSYGAREIDEARARRGDVVIYRSGVAYGHAALLMGDRRIIHVMPGHGCQMGEVDEGRLAAHPRRFFTIWRG